MGAQPQFDFWPAPSSPPSHLSPNRLPGVSPQSTERLRALLKLNHDEWHTLYDPVRHNHISHHLLALWSLGAGPEILQAGYDLHAPLQRPKGGVSTERITKDNFFDHLGDHAYYKSYVDFFTDVVRERGGIGALEEFLFSDEVNLRSERNPEMLNRFDAGILHPIIHVGYGAEFGLPGMFVEGLAQTAVNPANNGQIITKALFEVNSDRKAIHAFSILARLDKDERFTLPKLDSFQATIMDTVERSAHIPEFVLDWLPALELSLEAAQEKVKELEWAMTVVCGVPGFQAGKDFNADFLAMHLVTSSIFLSSLVQNLQPRSRSLLLRAHFANCLVFWVLLGKTPLDIAAFYDSDTAHPNTLNEALTPPSPSKFALPSSSSPFATNPNPWLFIVRHALVHPDDHVSKMVRTLYHYATKYGGVAAGTGYFGETELEGVATKLDGTLFVRIAGLVLGRVGKEVEELPEHLTFWDRRTLRNGLGGPGY